MSAYRGFKSAALLALLLLSAVSPSRAQTQPEPSGTRKIVRQVPARYPDLAKNTHTYGAVKLLVIVERNGSPKSIEVIGGNPVLVKAAQESVDKWKWAPAPSETIERVELRFQPQ